MNCHIIIHRKNSSISIRGKFEDLKQFLPLKCNTFPEHFTFRDNTKRMIEVSLTPDTPIGAKIGIDLAKQYLADLSKKAPGEDIRIGRKELTKIIRELQQAGESV